MVIRNSTANESTWLNTGQLQFCKKKAAHSKKKKNKKKGELDTLPKYCNAIHIMEEIKETFTKNMDHGSQKDVRKKQKLHPQLLVTTSHIYTL